MLEIAKRKIYPHNNVRFMQADAYNLEDIPGRYTAGFSGWWFSHIPKNRTLDFLHKFHQKLVTNGLVIFMDDTLAVCDLISSIDLFGNTYTIRQLKDNRQYEICKNFYTELELREIVRSIAININFFQFTYHWMLSYKTSHYGS